jgi:plasmid stabilization system protein ParE
VKKRLIIRARADLDLLHHYLYIAEHNPGQAERFRAAVQATTEQIRAHANRGTMLTHEAFAEIELRFMRPAGFRKYLLVYQVTDNCAFLLRILHSSQNLETELRPE